MPPNGRDCSHTEGDVFQGQYFTSYDSPGITTFKFGLVIVDLSRSKLLILLGIRVLLVLFLLMIIVGDNDDVDTVGVEDLANQLSSSSVA